MLYRALESLKITSTGRHIPAGAIDPLKKVSPETIAMLIAKKRIAKVQPPPLAILPGFEERAVEYAEKGIHDVNDMSGDEEDFDEALGWVAEPEGSPEPDPTWSRAQPWDAEHVYEMDKEGELVPQDLYSEVDEDELED